MFHAPWSSARSTAAEATTTAILVAPSSEAQTRRARRTPAPTDGGSHLRAPSNDAAQASATTRCSQGRADRSGRSTGSRLNARTSTSGTTGAATSANSARSGAPENHPDLAARTHSHATTGATIARSAAPCIKAYPTRTPPGPEPATEPRRARPR